MSRSIPGYATVAELAGELGVSGGTVRYYITTGQLKAYPTPRDWIIPQADADELLAARKRWVAK